ncbi:MAG: chemotaxis protein CheW [Thiogranum sp.]
MAGDAESMTEDIDTEIRAGVLAGDPLLVIPPASAFVIDSDAPVLRYGFRIGGLALLVPEGIATELLDAPAVFPLPRAPRWLAGMLNIRGNVVPLFNIVELLGSKSRSSAKERILVLGQASQAVAVYVDDLPKPLTTTGSVGDAGELPTILRPFVEAAFSDQGTHWFEFDYGEFFAHLSADGDDVVENTA